MREILVHDRDENETVQKILNIGEVPWTELLMKSETFKANQTLYLNLCAAFDIETTNVDTTDHELRKPYGFMYHWQFAIGLPDINEPIYTVFGRTWEDFMQLLHRIQHTLSGDPRQKLVIYVHNLSFEFMFMYRFLTITSIFARDKGKPIIVRTAENIEFRCSYMLSNMSLAKWCKSCNVKFYKRTDSYDYSRYRTFSTPMAPTEEEYCFCDVVGLVECLRTYMADDNMATIPMTSTGFIRREYREAMGVNPENRKLFIKTALDEEQYGMCKKSFRGGNVTSNAMYVGDILSNVGSYDRKSSYPAEMEMSLFPMSKFMEVSIRDESEFYYYLNTKAVLMTIVITDLKIIDIHNMAYISRSKVDAISVKCACANGRVLEAEEIKLTITDIDFKIIDKMYDYKKINVIKCYISDYGYLPVELRQYLLEIFRQKCNLDVAIQEMEERGEIYSQEYMDLKYYYGKSKNRLNSTFGMMVTDIASPDIIFDCTKEEPWSEEECKIADKLKTYYKSRNSFLSYQHGVWITANARKALQNGIDGVYNDSVTSNDVVYVDTDSVKFIEGHDSVFTRINSELDSIRSKLDIDIDVTVKDKTFKLGQWENEGTSYQFATMGSKKYLKFDGKKFYLTLAGVNKEKGAEYISKHGGMEAFVSKEPYLIIPKGDSGRTAAFYNYDRIDSLYDVYSDTYFTTAGNICILESSYEMSINGEYLKLIGRVK